MWQAKAVLRVLVALRKMFSLLFFLHIQIEINLCLAMKQHTKKKVCPMQGACVFCLRPADRSATGQRLGSGPHSADSDTVWSGAGKGPQAAQSW